MYCIRTMEAEVAWRDTVEQGPGQQAERDPRGERGDVWLERVCDQAGTPMSTIAFGRCDHGLWRVRSEQHGTHLVVSHAEALRVADTLTSGMATLQPITRSSESG